MTHNIEDHPKLRKIVTVAFKVFFAIIAGIAFALLFGYGIMWLWNWLMPDIFGLGTIGYWQAVGILVLAKVLFGGMGGYHANKSKNKGHRRCRKKEKHTFKNNMSNWKFYDKFWEEEGEDAYKAYVKRLTEAGEQAT